MSLFSQGIAQPVGALDSLVAKKKEDINNSPIIHALSTLDSSNPLYNLILEGGDSSAWITYINTDVASLEIPQLIKDASYTLTLAESGYHLYHTSGTAHTYTIPANSATAFPIGTVITFVNGNGAGVLSIAITTDTLRLVGTSSTGTRTMAANSMATILKVASTLWYINGTGVT